MIFGPTTVSFLFPLFMFIAGLAVGLLFRKKVIVYRLVTKDDLMKLTKRFTA